MVILCGSLFSLIEPQALAYSSPLYGRQTAQTRLNQIPIRYYHPLFPNKNRKKLIEMRAVTGSMPEYIELFPKAAAFTTPSKAAC